MTRYKY